MAGWALAPWPLWLVSQSFRGEAQGQLPHTWLSVRWPDCPSLMLAVDQAGRSRSWAYWVICKLKPETVFQLLAVGAAMGRLCAECSADHPQSSPRPPMPSTSSEMLNKKQKYGSLSVAQLFALCLFMIPLLFPRAAVFNSTRFRDRSFG